MAQPFRIGVMQLTMEPLAEMLGFVGDVIEDCELWTEPRPGEPTILHLLQPLAYRPGLLGRRRAGRRARLATLPGGVHPGIPGRTIH